MLQSFEGCMATQWHKDNARQHPNTTHAYTLLPSAGTFHSSLGFKGFLRYWFQGYWLKHQIESFRFNAAATENLQKSYKLESFKDPWWLTSNWIIRGVEVIKQSLIRISKDFQGLNCPQAFKLPKIWRICVFNLSSQMFISICLIKFSFAQLLFKKNTVYLITQNRLYRSLMKNSGETLKCTETPSSIGIVKDHFWQRVCTLLKYIYWLIITVKNRAKKHFKNNFKNSKYHFSSTIKRNPIHCLHLKLITTYMWQHIWHYSES